MAIRTPKISELAEITRQLQRAVDTEAPQASQSSTTGPLMSGQLALSPQREAAQGVR